MDTLLNLGIWTQNLKS